MHYSVVVGLIQRTGNVRGVITFPNVSGDKQLIFFKSHKCIFRTWLTSFRSIECVGGERLLVKYETVSVDGLHVHPTKNYETVSFGGLHVHPTASFELRLATTAPPLTYTYETVSVDGLHVHSTKNYETVSFGELHVHFIKSFELRLATSVPRPT